MDTRNTSATNNDEMQAPASEGRPWLVACCYVCFLAPFFFISYNVANTLASQKLNVPHIVFDWEHYIPFLPWTILPYWSIDLLYGISLFICSSKKELHCLGKRLISCQAIAVACFLLFPLKYTFQRPQSDGLFGDLFAALTSFDLPFNQAPSLHIALLVILWVHFPRHLPKLLLWPFHFLCFLIAVSVLTTFQHHFIDVPTGALLGWTCVWLWPINGTSIVNLRTNIRDENRRKLTIGGYYLAVSAACFGLSFAYQGWALWLLWPAISTLMVSTGYLILGVGVFQKNQTGQMSIAAQWLLFPYLIAAKINSRLWTKNINSADLIFNGLWLGRFPSKTDFIENYYTSVIDMTAEFTAPKSLTTKTSWHSISNLDLLTQSLENLQSAAEVIENAQKNGSTLICCALGYSRSATALAAWLFMYGHVSSIAEAIQLIQEKRPGIRLNGHAIDRLNELSPVKKTVERTVDGITHRDR